MISRLLNLVKAKLNKGMSQLETPEVLAEQAEQELQANVKKVKEGVVASVTGEKSLEKQIKAGTDEVATWEKRAAVAVSQNNEQLARECLQKKQELVQNLATWNAQLETQRKTTADLKKRYAELEEQLREFSTKKSNIIARGQASDAVSKANQLLSNTGSGGAAKWEQKIQEKEARAEAMHQMGGEPIGDKFAALDSQAQVEDDLAALKGQLAPPKLIVDTSEPAKTVVDDNLPMVVDEPKDDKDQSK